MHCFALTLRDPTYILFSCTLVGYFGADYADKNAYLVLRLINLVRAPIDALQGCLCDDV